MAKTQIGGLPKKRFIFRTVLWGTELLFVLGTFIYSMIEKQWDNWSVCLASLFLVSLPFLMSKIFRFEMHDAFFVFAELYALGPILGFTYKFYYQIAWWDDLLHFSGGVAFAVFGAYFAKFLNKKQPLTILMRAIFALCFSVMISVAWEVVEFSFDSWFGTDMQKDTVVSFINSYLLGVTPDQIGSIEKVSSLFINGVEIPLGGYLDIGLIDTMTDLIVEGLGALIVSAVLIIDRDKHMIMQPVSSEKQRQDKKDDESV